MNVFTVLCVLVPAVLGSVVYREAERPWFASAACQNYDVSTCLGVGAVAFLNRMSRSGNIEVFNGLTLARNPEADTRASRALNVNEIESSLPDEPSERAGRLMDLLTDGFTDFISTHSINFKPTATDLEEGRGKIKKYVIPLVIGIVGKIIALGPIVLGGLALLTIKALVVAKIAFFLAAALGLPKLLGGLGGIGGKGGLGSSGSSSSGWSSSGGPYYRSFDENAAQQLAYKAHASQ